MKCVRVFLVEKIKVRDIRSTVRVRVMVCFVDVWILIVVEVVGWGLFVFRFIYFVLFIRL